MSEFEGECAGALRAASGGSSRSYVAFGGNRTSGALEVAAALNAKGGTGRGDFESETLIAFDCKASGQNGFGVGEVAPTLRAMGHADSHQNAGGQVALAGAVGVRRITPNEAEILQGFPKGYTLIKMSRNVRAKVTQEMADYYRRTGQELEGLSDEDLCRLAADGPRYKVLGNSFAVPVVAWIGRRIATAIAASKRRAA